MTQSYDNHDKIAKEEALKTFYFLRVSLNLDIVCAGAT